MAGANFLIFFVFGISLALGANHKNVLVLLADDGGFQQSAYHNKICDTPNLDKLAQRSVTFTKGYTSVSSGSPSRSVMLSGLPQHQNGLYGLTPSTNHFQSFDGVRSLPHILSSHHIYTGIIGKYSVAPRKVYKFDYEQFYDLDQCGRNITNMKNLVNDFLTKAKRENKPFYLYIGIHDPHRNPGSKWGNFMNYWGNGEYDNGTIPDWKPRTYDPESIQVPHYLPNTPSTKKDMADMYTAFNRLDQGIGLYMRELEKFGLLDDTLVLWTSDNAIPFVNAKTTLYEPGMAVPMMISSPDHKEHWGKYSNALTSTIDFVPTVLDWFKVPFPRYSLMGKKVFLTGRSLLPLTANPAATGYDHVFSSHDLHEISDVYPMRVMRDEKYRFIHNINNRAPYPIAGDIFYSPTFLDLLHKTKAGQPTNWFKTLHQYYYRDEWELYDLDSDPSELHNLAYNPKYKPVVDRMNKTLTRWIFQTADPWRCMPHSMLLGNGCFPMYNEYNHTYALEQKLGMPKNG